MGQILPLKMQRHSLAAGTRAAGGCTAARLCPPCQVGLSFQQEAPGRLWTVVPCPSCCCVPSTGRLATLERVRRFAQDASQEQQKLRQHLGVLALRLGIPDGEQLRALGRDCQVLCKAGACG